MKNSLHTNPILFKMMVLITCFMLAMFYSKSKAAGLSNTSHTITTVNQQVN
jgi:hypothetical protein